MEKFNVNHFKTPTKTPWKASIAERGIRTIKTRLWRYFQKTHTKRWVDVLDDFVKNYNSTPHSSIGMAPNDVTKENRAEVYKKLFPDQSITVECRHRVGDLVRKIIIKKEFAKGYEPNWSEEVYVISKEIQSNSVCWYRLTDQSGEQVPGIFYSDQLNLVSRLK